MTRGVVVEIRNGRVRVRLNSGNRIWATNALNQRPPLGAIVYLEHANGQNHIIGRPR